MGTARPVATLADMMSAPAFLPALAQQAQEGVGTGAGIWWFVVWILGALTVGCGLGWLIVKRRTLPPAKQPYVPPNLPAGPTRTQRGREADQETSR